MIKQYAQAYHEVLSMLMEQVQKVTSANGAALEVREEEHMTYLSVTGVLRDFLGYQLPIKNTFSGRCIKTNKPFACANILTNPEAEIARKTFNGFPIQSMLLLPIFSQDGSTVKAVIKLTSENPEYFTPQVTEEFYSWVEPFLKSISAAMVDAETYATNVQNNAHEASLTTFARFHTQLFTNESDLKDTFVLFSTLAEFIDLGVFVTNLSGQCLYSNTAFQHIRDLTEKEMLEDWVRNVNEDDMKNIQEAWNISITSESKFMGRFRCLDKAGKTKYVDVQTVPLFKDDEIFGYIGIAEEVSSMLV
jgi:PAS domain S-box-containing protein